ncbi:MAG: hypothetical protein AABM29_06075 [Actinomycetota bacterium]
MRRLRRSFMALSDDQRAMLQLLLERGQSYEDIGSLLGLEVDDVRARARAALTEIGGEDPDREVGLTDYLLGQADPIGRADAARHLQSDPAARDLAHRLVTHLRVLAPGAQLPDLPGERGRPQRSAPAPAPGGTEPAATGPGRAERVRGSVAGFAGSLGQQQRRLIAALIAGGALVLVVVLIATGAFGGGDGGGSGDGGTSAGGGNPNASNLTRAVLTGQNGSDASGVAVFARVRNTPVLQINVNGLESTGPGQAYVIWLYGSDARAFPLSREPLDKANLRGAAPIPAQVLQALQQGLFDSVDVSLARDAQMTAALRTARRTQQLPRYAGESVVRGPIVGPGFAGSGASDGAGPNSGG